MANSRRASLQKGNVVSLAEAREKRDAARTQEADEPSASEENLSLQTLGQVTESLKNQKAAQTEQTAEAAPGNTESSTSEPGNAEPSEEQVQPSLEATVESSKKGKGTKARKVSNRTYNKEKVEALKKAIAEGSYQINHQRVADRFIEREAQL